MWIKDIFGYSICGVPLWVILLCGFLGVLVDFDHFIAYYWRQGTSTRFLHTPMLIIGSGILCVALAYIGRLLLKMVLK